MGVLAIADTLCGASAVTYADGAIGRVPERSICAAAGGERRRLWDAGAVRRGIEVESDSMKPALLFGGDYNAFALWSCRPRGTGEEPRFSFAAWLRAGWRLFRGLEKRKVWGEESEAERRDLIPLLVRRGGREAVGVVAHEPVFGVGDHNVGG